MYMDADFNRRGGTSWAGNGEGGDISIRHGKCGGGDSLRIDEVSMGVMVKPRRIVDTRKRVVGCPVDGRQGDRLAARKTPDVDTHHSKEGLRCGWNIKLSLEIGKESSPVDLDGKRGVDILSEDEDDRPPRIRDHRGWVWTTARSSAKILLAVDIPHGVLGTASGGCRAAIAVSALSVHLKWVLGGER